MSEKYNEFTYSVISTTTESKIEKSINGSSLDIKESKDKENKLFKVAFGLTTVIIISSTFMSPNQNVSASNISSVNKSKSLQRKVLNASNNSIKTINLNDLINAEENKVKEENKMSNTILQKAQIAKSTSAIAIALAFVFTIFFIFNGYGIGLILYTWFAFLMTPVFFKGTELIERRRSNNDGNES